MQQLPVYQCHKKVQAIKIASITYLDRGDAILTPENNGYNSFKVSREYLHKHRPQIGGYYVLYEDGYESFSPGDVFESGYTLTQE